MRHKIRDYSGTAGASAKKSQGHVGAQGPRVPAQFQGGRQKGSRVMCKYVPPKPRRGVLPETAEPYMRAGCPRTWSKIFLSPQPDEKVSKRPGRWRKVVGSVFRATLVSGLYWAYRPRCPRDARTAPERGHLRRTRYPGPRGVLPACRFVGGDGALSTRRTT